MHDRHFVSSRRLGLGVILGFGIVALASTGCAREAPQSFEEQNGLLEAAAFEEAEEAFAEVEDAAGGLGVHFNANSCAACHLPPGKQLPGGSSAVTELRAGHAEGGKFVPAAGGTLITLQALPGFMSEVSALPDSENVRDRFISPSLFGVGFVEAVADETLRGIAQEQALKTQNRIRGLVREVDVLEASGKRAVGRFGWAAQHASLLSFSADAYRNEMGITSPLQPTDNTFFGQPVDDGIPDPEDTGGDLGFGEDVELFALFMRALSAPPRVFPSDGSGRADIDAGQKIFELIGCDVCHRTTLVTADTGAPMNGGAITVPSALGKKTIHPFGDFLMHDVGTGSAIVREGSPAETEGKVRTAPLWGLGTRQSRSFPLLHDGSAKTLPEAIQRHRNTAAEEATKFQQLPEADKAKVLRFLQSL